MPGGKEHNDYFGTTTLFIAEAPAILSTISFVYIISANVYVMRNENKCYGIILKIPLILQAMWKSFGIPPPATRACVSICWPW